MERGTDKRVRPANSRWQRQLRFDTCGPPAPVQQSPATSLDRGGATNSVRAVWARANDRTEHRAASMQVARANEVARARGAPSRAPTATSRHRRHPSSCASTKCAARRRATQPVGGATTVTGDRRCRATQTRSYSSIRHTEPGPKERRLRSGCGQAHPGRGCALPRSLVSPGLAALLSHPSGLSVVRSVGSYSRSSR